MKKDLQIANAVLAECKRQQAAGLSLDDVDVESLVPSKAYLPLNDDGTIRGLHFSQASGARGAILTVAIQRGKPGGWTTTMIVDGKDFHTVYARMVNAIIENRKINDESEIAQLMHKSIGPFMDKFGLKTEIVSYRQVIREDVVK